MSYNYSKEPKNKGQGLSMCCSCPEDKQKPVEGMVNVKLHHGVPEPIKKQWCAECGLYLTIKDQDKYFPAKQWVDTRALDKLENIEKDDE